MRALVSIHDLMPETMDRVHAILKWLQQQSIPPVTLLVVPNKAWSSAGIDQLRRLAEVGHPLAAHGWCHQTEPRRPWHRLHAALISRKVAEHLALDSAGILKLMQQSHHWFLKQGLPEPTLYVPPAWALGGITAKHLAKLPFAQIETTSGLLQRDAFGRYVMRRLPLTGYEADTAFRAVSLRKWNRWQARSAEKRHNPLRISIHPDDFQLRLQDQLEAQIRSARNFIAYDSLISRSSAE